VADYGGTNDLAGSNVCIDVEVLSTTSACSCEGLDPDVYIYATQASANGTTPGDNFAGSFNIRVKNCTGDDIGSIKVQGGAAGWLTYKDIDYANTSSFDEYNTKDTGGKSKGKNPYSAATNTIFSLIGSLDDGECKDIRITEAGLIDPNAAPGTNMFMSGPWSAAWDNEKSDYTGRVTFEVTDTP